jgi:mannosylglycerate hydrolase
LVSEITMRLPSRGNREQQRRGDQLADLTIRTAVTLRAGQEHVEVNVSFENRHEDHYLRVMFPTGLPNATHVDAGGHFIVDRRPIRPQGPMPEAVWPDMATLPQNNFIDVSDGKAGLAFLNDSLTEYEVLDNAERTVALSLLRAVRDWICTEIRVGSSFPSQKGGQALGHHAIRYAIRPHAGDWQQANIPLVAEQFNVSLRLAQTRAHEGKLPGTQASLFEVDNPMLRFAALKKAEDRNTFVVRLYNPTGVLQRGRLRFVAALDRAWETNLNEKREHELKVTKSNELLVTANPYKIVTVEVKTKQRAV